jgi:outer membrane protein OmpA-like peptidoglycan-associated protein
MMQIVQKERFPIFKQHTFYQTKNKRHLLNRCGADWSHRTTKSHTMKRLSHLFLFLAAAGILFGSCKNMSKSQKGVLIGAGAGGAVGAGVGKAAGNTALGAIIGATVGGVAGGIIGRKMDKQAEEISSIPGAEVKRVGEGINVTFESGVLFGHDESNVTTDADKKLADLSEILNKYPDTYVLVEGHTDASGADNYNDKLSKRRAQSVARALKSKGVDNSRIKTAWYGEEQPKFPNDTQDNMAKNRRVEFAIYANEQLKKQAQEEAVTKNN